MAVGLNVLEFFNRSINLTIGSIFGKRMVELGDQKLHDFITTAPGGGRVWFKDWIEARGCHHYSIDIHGKNGSHALDLSQWIPDPFWHDNFDIVTNFGTSEHVERQAECWRNIHNLGRPGAVYIHVLPQHKKYRPDHCNHFYDKEFFESLSGANGYTLIVNEPLPTLGHTGACYIKPRKTDGFVWDDKWVRRAG